MKIENKKTWILTSLVCLIPIIVAIILYDRMPDQIPTHWGANGDPNQWSSKFTGTIVLPGLLFLLNLAFPFLLRVDPKYQNISAKMKNLLHWLIPIIELFASSITLASANGIELNINFCGSLFIGFIFVIIGNYLPKVAQSYTVGIKLPWTLADEENWNKTHRMAGYVWVVCGILMIATVFLPSSSYIFCGLVAIMVLAPTVYSYLLFRSSSHQDNDN